MAEPDPEPEAAAAAEAPAASAGAGWTVTGPAPTEDEAPDPQATTAPPAAPSPSGGNDDDDEEEEEEEEDAVAAPAAPVAAPPVPGPGPGPVPPPAVPRLTVTTGRPVLPHCGDGSVDVDDDDVAAKAAVTLAAVAAAATANHASPAEAAREARLAARSFIATDQRQRQREAAAAAAAAPPVVALPLSAVQAALREAAAADAASSPPLLRALLASSDGGGGGTESAPPHPHPHPHPQYNPALLQHLLLLERVRGLDDSDAVAAAAPVAPGGASASAAAAAATATVTAGATAAPSAGDAGAAADNDDGVDDATDDDDDDDLEGADDDAAVARRRRRRRPTARDAELARQAQERLLALLRKLETAHDCLREQTRRGGGGSASSGPVKPAPPNEATAEGHHDAEDDDTTTSTSSHSSDPALAVDDDALDCETPVVVPDLLPPCTSRGGDATLAFFRACAGAAPPAPPRAPPPAATDAAAPSGPAAGEPSDADAAAAAATTATVDEATGHVADMLSSGGAGSGSAAGTAGQAAAAFLGSFLKRSAPAASSGATGSGAGTSTAASKAASLSSLLMKRGRGKASGHAEDDADAPPEGDSGRRYAIGSGGAALPEDAYLVRIDREMLGLTVENVLERTVVRTVLAGGPAKQAGAKVGSLILQVGSVSTAHLTHFETIDELRQSQRPLNLVLRHLSDDSLRRAREEMGRLIKGSGFGVVMDAHYSSQQGPLGVNNGSHPADGPGSDAGAGKDVRPLIGADLRIDAYTSLLRRRFQEVNANMKSRKDEAIALASEKLVWILTLFVIGLEKESARLYALSGMDASRATPPPHDDSPTPSPPASPKRQHSQYSHTAKDYSDAAKSVAKVLLDFTRKRLDPNLMSPQKSRAAGFLQHSLESATGTVRRRGAKVPPPPPTVGRVAAKDGRTPHAKPLLQIGDVLQRTRTFLADPTSPPAALLRGELISFLCDVLDIDTDMELAEEESATAMAGGSTGKAGMINDLGSAGSLLKVIILNCPIMRSPCCEAISGQQKRKLDPETEKELRQRFGPRANFTTSDLHRLHAGNRFLSVVHRLAASRSTSARITACSLGPVLWGHLDFPHQLQLRGVITRALHDVEVIVRKSTATVLHEIAELVFDRRAVPWLILMCERAMTDPEPQLRSAAMTLTWHLAEHLPNAFLGNASQGSRFLRRLPSRDDPIFADVYLLQCKLLPVATRLAEDRSPSVRLAVAAQCDRLCDALGDHWSSVIIDVLLALLSDTDDRVRCEAAACVPRLAEIVMLSVQPGEVARSETSVLEALIPASIKLQKDNSVSVRVALATAAGELLTLLVALQARVDSISSESGSVSERFVVPGGDEPPKKYKKHVDDRLIPLVQALLNDKDPEVTSAALRAVTNATRNSVQTQHHSRRMSVASVDDDMSLSSFQSHQSERPVFSPVLSEKQVLRLLPTLTELADSRQWRVRQSAVEIVPALLGCTHQLETRTEISKLCVRLMADQVDAVRRTAAECLCMGGSSLGSHGEDASAEWFASIVVPTIRTCAVHSLSKQRLLSLKMVEVMLTNGAFPARWKGEDAARLADSPLRELAGIALSLTGDHIANVRLNVGRVLENVLRVFEEEDLFFIAEVLEQQMEAERTGDRDQDVLFFAQRCAERARTIVEERRAAHLRDDSSAILDD